MGDAIAPSATIEVLSSPNGEVAVAERSVLGARTAGGFAGGGISAARAAGEAGAANADGRSDVCAALGAAIEPVCFVSDGPAARDCGEGTTGFAPGVPSDGVATAARGGGPCGGIAVDGFGPCGACVGAGFGALVVDGALIDGIVDLTALCPGPGTVRGGATLLTAVLVAAGPGTVVLPVGFAPVPNKRAAALPGAGSGGLLRGGGSGGRAGGATELTMVEGGCAVLGVALVVMVDGNVDAVDFCASRSAAGRTADSSATSSAASFATSMARSSSPASIK